MTRSIARLLLTSGVSFGILGADEQSDGNETHALGETGLFTEIARQNIEAWNRIGVRKIITISPHAYHALRNEYPKYGPGFLVYHYTQVLSTVVQQHPVKSKSSARVTYHDSCYLGRWNRIYLEPRAILNSIKGLKLIEMDRSMQNALCCGGGGGNFFTDVLGTGSDLSSRARIREALTTGADIIAVSCPQCFRMLDDAVKAQDAQEKIRVMEISEIMNAALT
jgi:Fe-S oxidoreductase